MSQDYEFLSQYDYTIVMGKTASGIESPNLSTAWRDAQSTLLNLMLQCEALDSDGITIYVSSMAADSHNPFQRYEQVKSQDLEAIIKDHHPPQHINLVEVLEDIFSRYLDRKAAHQTKPNGEIIVIFLDGEPLDRMKIVTLIKAITHKIDNHKELGLGFMLVGDDPVAMGFFNSLDDDLESVGAQFDIVESGKLIDIQEGSIIDFLMRVIYD